MARVCCCAGRALVVTADGKRRLTMVVSGDGRVTRRVRAKLSAKQASGFPAPSLLAEHPCHPMLTGPRRHAQELRLHLPICLRRTAKTRGLKRAVVVGKKRGGLSKAAEKALVDAVCI